MKHCSYADLIARAALARLRLAFCLTAALGFIPAARATPPIGAHGKFVSHAYALTFDAPPGLTYCRIADGWTGSDHGTILFLVPPRDCGGVGYPSISRGFDPPSTPRIEVEYERWDSDEPPPRYACSPAGRIVFLGRLRTVCRSREGALTAFSVRGLYTADSDTQAIVTLLTKSARIRRDLPVWRRLVATVRSCTMPWRDAAGRQRVSGSGQPCPESGGFY